MGVFGKQRAQRARGAVAVFGFLPFLLLWDCLLFIWGENHPPGGEVKQR